MVDERTERMAHDLFVRAREDDDHRYAEQEIAACLAAEYRRGLADQSASEDVTS